MGATQIRLVEEDEWWVATDISTGVTSQGETHEKALAMLDEAVALRNDEIGKSIDSSEEERAVLEDLGIDPDEVEVGREENDELPGFMR